MSARPTGSPGPKRSVWVLPGAIVAGSWVGVVVAVGATVPAALADAAGSVAPAYWMHVFAESTFGAVVGAALGLPAGLVAFVVLTVGRGVRLRRRRDRGVGRTTSP